MKKIIIVMIVVVLLIAGFYVFNEKAEENTTAGTPAPDFEDVDERRVINNGEITSEHTIEFTSEGYSPNTLTIKKGDTVNFINNGDKLTWPASDIHPTHTLYPNSDIKKCETNEKNKIFDACRGLQKGETYPFTFNEVGEWEYHDHFSPRKKGTITVG